MLVPFTSINFPNVKAQEYGNYDNMYSKYPTEVNKYECRTGPFEGFFVSSVEFCKHVKFDDNKDDRKDNRVDNKTGMQGPPGPAGPQGPSGPQGERGLTGATGMTGPASTVPGPQGERGFNGTDGVNGTQGIQGPPGITNLNNTNTYLVTTSGNPNLGFALCIPGDFVTTGGYSSGPLSGSPVVNRPTLAPTLGGWEVQIDIPTGTGVTFSVYAVCFDNPPLRP
jgi:hypothetical protein